MWQLQIETIGSRSAQPVWCLEFFRMECAGQGACWLSLQRQVVVLYEVLPSSWEALTILNQHVLLKSLYRPVPIDCFHLLHCTCLSLARKQSLLSPLNFPTH